MRIQSMILFGALIVTQLGVAGCADDPGDNAVDRRLDCKAICDRYAECFDSDYDVEGCYDGCVEEADKDDKFEDKVDECSSCISDASCTKGAFKCATECIAIVP